MFIRSQDRFSGTPDDFYVRMPPNMLPQLGPGQILTVSVLKVVIPIKKFQPDSIDSNAAVPILHPTRKRVLEGGVKKVGLHPQHMCLVHTSLPSNNLTPAGFTSTLVAMPISTSFKEDPGSQGEWGHIVFDDSRQEQGIATIWYRGIDVIRIWLTVEDDEPQPALFSEDWFLILAFDVLDPDVHERAPRLMAGMLDTLQLMLVRQDQQDQRVDRLVSTGNFF